MYIGKSHKPIFQSQRGTNIYNKQSTYTDTLRDTDMGLSWAYTATLRDTDMGLLF